MTVLLDTCALVALRIACAAAALPGHPPRPVRPRARRTRTGECVHRAHRRSDAWIAQLIEEGVRGSSTFRTLVETIDATDGIVYVQRGDCGRGVRACLVLAVQVAGPSRILRIVVNIRRERLELITAIGHELHHAVEVLANPEITTTERMFVHFLNGRQTIGPTERFETQEAIRAGMQIENELRAGRQEA